MIELRYASSALTKKPVLQYRALFYPVMIASGDIVLMPHERAEWMNVPIVEVLVKEDATDD